MRNLILVSIMLFGSSNVFAQAISCKLDVLLADQGGFLMPSEENLSITTNIVDEATISPEVCSNIKRGNLKISLCATEANYLGGLV